MNVLITGCNGFVGTFLSTLLAEKKTNVFGLDMASEPRDERVKYGQVDITDQEAVITFAMKWQIDAVYHLAAVANPRVGEQDPAMTARTNLLGTLSFLELARMYKKIRVLVVGSSEQYRTKSGPYIRYQENDELEPHNIYGATKVASEVLGREYVRQFGIDVLFTRSFNHTGEGQLPVYVLSDFARQCALIALGRQRPVLEVGNIEAARDFLDVRDVARAYAAIMERGVAGEVYNVCSGTAYSLSDLLGKLIAMTGAPSVTITVDSHRLRHYDPPIIFGDNTKLTLHTGWRPLERIDDTLRRLYDHWVAVEDAASH